MAAEVLIDPLNWLSWFSKPIAKGATMGAIKATGMASSSTLDDVVSEAVNCYFKGNKKGIMDNLADAAIKLGINVDADFINGFTKAMELLTENAVCY